MTDHGLGYLHDHPLEAASRANPARWPATLLLGDDPMAAIPASFRCPGVRPAALDQDGVGACVAFSGTSVLNAEEASDEGANLFASGTWTGDARSTGAYRTYYDLKHGYGSYPGDGAPYADGSYPEALWKLALAEGLVDARGDRHKISAYYSGGLADAPTLQVMQRVMMTVGPVQIGMPWMSLWMSPPSAPRYRLPAPTGGYAGGHAIACVGWDTDPDGTVWLVFVNSWGDWTDAAGHFAMRADWLWAAPLGPQVFWKAVDAIEHPHTGVWTITVAHNATVDYPTVAESPKGVFHAGNPVAHKVWTGATVTLPCSRPQYDPVTRLTFCYVRSGLWRKWVHAAGAGVSVKES